MATVDLEINSFVTKFQQLWKAGRDAHMDFETHAGKAWVNLRLGLGEYPSDSIVKQHHLKRLSPSRLRRRERRAADRLENSNILQKDNVKDNSVEDVN